MRIARNSKEIKEAMKTATLFLYDGCQSELATKEIAGRYLSQKGCSVYRHITATGVTYYAIHFGTGYIWVS